MKIKRQVLVIIALIFSLSAHAENNSLDASLQQVVNAYLAQHKSDEHITAVAMSVSLPKEDKIRSYYAGKVAEDKDAIPISKNNLYQIGSITKSFTAAIVLQLEAEGKLNINQTIGDWLPQYPVWKNITIKQLLNMSSGIPDYLANAAIADIIEKNIEHQWTNEKIVSHIYPAYKNKQTYNYSNTNYLLLAMIVEKVTHHSFTDEMNKRLLLAKYQLNNMVYAEAPLSNSIMNRMTHGYNYDNSFPPTLYAKDMTRMNLSYAGAAGGLLADPVDIIHWVKILFSTTLYPQKQLDELTSVISTTTGKPIKELTQIDSSGFGLGVSEKLNTKFGKLWTYEGGTLGYRALYVMPQCNHIIVSIILNSKTRQDHIFQLFNDAYKVILTAHPEYQCKL